MGTREGVMVDCVTQITKKRTKWSYYSPSQLKRWTMLPISFLILCNNENSTLITYQSIVNMAGRLLQLHSLTFTLNSLYCQHFLNSWVRVLTIFVIKTVKRVTGRKSSTSIEAAFWFHSFWFALGIALAPSVI